METKLEKQIRGEAETTKQHLSNSLLYILKIITLKTNSFRVSFNIINKEGEIRYVIIIKYCDLN